MPWPVPKGLPITSGDRDVTESGQQEISTCPQCSWSVRTEERQPLYPHQTTRPLSHCYLLTFSTLFNRVRKLTEDPGSDVQPCPAHGLCTPSAQLESSSCPTPCPEPWTHCEPTQTWEPSPQPTPPLSHACVHSISQKWPVILSATQGKHSSSLRDKHRCTRRCWKDGVRDLPRAWGAGEAASSGQR